MIAGQMQIEKGRNATQNEGLPSYVREGTALTIKGTLEDLYATNQDSRGQRELGNRQNFGETIWRDSYKNRGGSQKNAEQRRGSEGRRVTLKADG